MQIAVVTLFPEMLRGVTDYGVSGKAVDRGLLQVSCVNPRDFTEDKHQTVDDRPYGGGPGMVMMNEPLRAAIGEAKARVQLAQQLDEASPSTQGLGESSATELKNPKVVYMSPQGAALTQEKLASLLQQPLVLIAGRYEGIDERVIDAEVDEELSIGDYVLSGGELAAMVVIDGVSRLLPGALGHADSAAQDSFSDGLLDCPHYTRPETYEGVQVPPVLLSGNHEEIRRWRLQQSLGRTWLRRPELLAGRTLSAEEETLLAAFKREHDEF